MRRPQKSGVHGDPGGTRTPNPQFRRLMLYPVELRGRLCNYCNGSLRLCEGSSIRRSLSEFSSNSVSPQSGVAEALNGQNYLLCTGCGKTTLYEWAPRVIHNDEELEAYTNALFRLTVLDNPSRVEQEAVERLTLLIERYEAAHYPIPRAMPFPWFVSGPSGSRSATWLRNSARKMRSPYCLRDSANSLWSK